MGDQYEINLLLSRLSTDDRETLAKMIANAVETGVFETLKSLEQYQIDPREHPGDVVRCLWIPWAGISLFCSRSSRAKPHS
jgi:hypothetical protein